VREQMPDHLLQGAPSMFALQRTIAGARNSLSHFRDFRELMNILMLRKFLTENKPRRVLSSKECVSL
jgi:hypothetical protein